MIYFYNSIYELFNDKIEQIKKVVLRNYKPTLKKYVIKKMMKKIMITKIK